MEVLLRLPKDFIACGFDTSHHPNQETLRERKYSPHGLDPCFHGDLFVDAMVSFHGTEATIKGFCTIKDSEVIVETSGGILGPYPWSNHKGTSPKGTSQVQYYSTILDLHITRSYPIALKR